MNIPELFSTKERLSLLSKILFENGEIRIHDIARKAKTSPAQAHKYVLILERNGLVKNRKLVDSAKTREMRALLNLKKIEDSGAVNVIRKAFPKPNGIGVFGSWADGTNNSESDIDLWARVPQKADEAQVAAAKKAVEAKLGSKADLIVVSPEMQSSLRLKSEAFYYSLYHGKALWGEGF
ncbi:MAG: nucleotidyltransferase domain-containing protein [Candidatus Micrarchaeia archaeon]|jgi:predicted nucleotidyltransferase